MELSVIICTHNPRTDYLRRVLNALRQQTLGLHRWELIVIDNGSTNDVLAQCDLSWHPYGRLVVEDKLGLTAARRRGIGEAKAEILVFVDDDNLLAPEYLASAVEILSEDPEAGVVGGVIEPDWPDGEPETWCSEFFPYLALRNYGQSRLIAKTAGSDALPEFIPVGAGMVIRRAAIRTWLDANENYILPDRRGSELSSGGDTEMVMHARQSGWSVGYFPELKLTHIIPGHRLTSEYLARLVYALQKGYVPLLFKYGIVPWPPAAPYSVWLRKLRSYIRCRAWAGPAEYIRWRGSCGLFDGRAAIYSRFRSTPGQKG
jgi:glycosyltransferase involved in cell wall biosynthesis